jgi:hypothetical protein
MANLDDELRPDSGAPDELGDVPIAIVRITDLPDDPTPQPTDVVPIVDLGANVNKKTTIGAMFSALIGPALRSLLNGSAAAPSVAFKNDGGTGLFLADPGVLGVATQGQSAVVIDPTQNVRLASSGAVTVPNGLTQQRPKSPIAGMFRFNATTKAYEGFNGTDWVPLTGGSGPAVINPGTVDAPGLPFSDEGDTGIYQPKPGAFGISTKGRLGLVVDDQQNVQVGGYGFIDIPAGTTAQRPATPNSGMLRFNTTIGEFEGWTGTEWMQFGGGFKGQIQPGSPTAPGLEFVSSPETGLYSPGLNQFGISTGGLAAVIVDDQQNVYITGDNYLRIPSGSDAQRPGGPVPGMIRYNTTSARFEGWNGSIWGAFGDGERTIDPGTAATPGLPFTGDASTGIYQPVPGTFGISTKGKSALVVDDQQNVQIRGAGFIDIPAGTTAQRPATPNSGMIRFNTDTGSFEGYDASGWVNFGFSGFRSVPGGTAPAPGLAFGGNPSTGLYQPGNNELGIATGGQTAAIFDAQQNLSLASTGFLDIPAGTDGQRPAAPNSGMFRFNTTAGAFEGYNGTVWKTFGQGGAIAPGTAAAPGLPFTNDASSGLYQPALGQFGIATGGKGALVVDQGQNLQVLGTGFLDIPAGTTAQRPATPNSGMIRFNTSLGAFEGHNGTTWSPFGFSGWSSAPDGTAALPGVGFGAATGTGLWRQTADGALGLSVAGTAALTIGPDLSVSLKGTGFLDIPAGTDAQRPAAPNSGMLRFNTTASAFEGYNGTSWIPFGFPGFRAVPQGTVAAPGLAFSGDGGTGLFSPGQFKLDLVTYGKSAIHIDEYQDIYCNSNGALRLPGGDDSQRPANPVIGMVRYSTSYLSVEAYTGTQWIKLTGFPGWNMVGTGTVTAPGLAFTIRQDTGLYLNGDGSLGVATGGKAAALFDQGQNLFLPSTGYMIVPVGTTGQRPASTAPGMLRFNADLKTFEGYTGNGWTNFGFDGWNTAPGGTVAAPGIAFGVNASTGIYQTALNTLGIATGGKGALVVDANQNTSFLSSGFIDLPTGTTAQRPAAPNGGMFRFNTDLASAEVYNGQEWTDLGFPGWDTVPDGTVSAPGLAFAKSPSTGIYSTRPGTLSIATNGAPALFIDDEQNVEFPVTGQLTLPKGGTGQRPGTPYSGNIRFNTDLAQIEFFNGSTWQQLGTADQPAPGPDPQDGIGLLTWYQSIDVIRPIGLRDRCISVQSRMRRCVFNPQTGQVVYYLDADDSTKQAGPWVRVVETQQISAPYTGTLSEQPNPQLRDGVPNYDPNISYMPGQRVLYNGKLWEVVSNRGVLGVAPAPGTQPAVIDSTAGPVMVEIPAFSVRFTVTGGHNVTMSSLSWEITDGIRYDDGFNPHPAFVAANGRTRTRIYVAAYHCISQGKGATSGADTFPISNENRASWRSRAQFMSGSLAQNIHIMSVWDYSAIAMLMMVEFQSVNSQAALGKGYCTGNAPNVRTGASTPWGNRSQNRYTGSTTDFMSYRGLENIYGYLWTFIDGVNINPDIGIYTCSDPAKYADDTTNNYTQAGSLPYTSRQYLFERTLQAHPYLIAPASTVSTAAPTKYTGDTLSTDQTGAFFSVRIGGDCNSTDGAGICAWDALWTSTSGKPTNTGARIAFAWETA